MIVTGFVSGFIVGVVVTIVAEMCYGGKHFK